MLAYKGVRENVGANAVGFVLEFYKYVIGCTAAAKLMASLQSLELFFLFIRKCIIGRA